MNCPKCKGPDSMVIETRDIRVYVRRRRECMDCKERFTTYERVKRRKTKAGAA